MKVVTREYSEAITEVLEILANTNKEDVDKIPAKFIDFLKQNKSTTYKPKLDHTKRIKDMNLRKETIGILTIISKKFWCNDKQREKLDKKLKENELRYRESIR